jgi:hypothetical protein
MAHWLLLKDVLRFVRLLLCLPLFLAFRWPMRAVFAQASAGGIEVTNYLDRVRPLAGILALIFGLTLVAPSAFAAEPAAPARPLAAAAAAKVESMPVAALAQAKPATVPGEASKPFFKTGKGAAAAILIAGALAMTFVSYSKDRVQSPKNAATVQ